MIEVTIKFKEITIADGTKYLVSPPVAIPTDFDFSTIEDNNHFKDWINEEWENNLYDMNYIRVPNATTGGSNINGATALESIQMRYGSDCEVKRVTENCFSLIEKLN